jgi:hypothetical protein
MALFTGPVFGMARKQFHLIADHFEIPEDERDRLLMPKRAIEVSCPIHMNDRRTAVFNVELVVGEAAAKALIRLALVPLSHSSRAWGFFCRIRAFRKSLIRLKA